MRLILVLFGRALRAWWSEFLFLLVLNLLWLLAQATIILGPPMTAALYAVSGRVIDRDLTDFGDVWRAVRESFGAAWIWGAAQLAVYGVLGYNLLAYRNAPGLLVLSLRYAWLLLLAAWFAVNLYYWPLYLAQTDRRFTTTLGNAIKMGLLNGNFTVLYTLAALLLIVISVASGVLLGAAVAVWLALWGTLVVRDRLAAAGVRE